MQQAINFFFLKPLSSLRERGRLKRFISEIFKKEGYRLQGLSLIFCSDKYLLKINKQYLHHNYYTDIITFNLSGADEAIEAEIYISVDRIKENAKSLNTTIKEEIHRVVFHGCLHLCGYNDKTPKELKNMRKAEDHLINHYFKKNGFT